MGGGKVNKKHRAEIAAANKDPSKASFSTEHGSQGVTNVDYADYVRRHPDLMANYNKHWKRGAPEPFSQNNAGISLAEYGAMHYAEHGRGEGRGFPNQEGLLGGDGSDSGSGNTGGLLDAAWADNLNFPMLLSEYNAPNYAPMTNPWGGATIGASYMPWTVEGMANVPEQARSYIAPELTLEHPRYITNPLGLLQLPPDWEDLIDVEDEEEEEEEQEQGRNVGTDEGKGKKDQQGHKAQQKKAEDNAKKLAAELGMNAGE